MATCLQMDGDYLVTYYTPASVIYCESDYNLLLLANDYDYFLLRYGIVVISLQQKHYMLL